MPPFFFFLFFYLDESESFGSSVKMTQNICGAAERNIVAVKWKLRKCAEVKKKIKKSKIKAFGTTQMQKLKMSWLSRGNDAIVFFFFL